MSREVESALLKLASDDIREVLEKAAALLATATAAAERPAIERVLAEVLEAGLSSRMDRAVEMAGASAAVKFARIAELHTAWWACSVVLALILGFAAGWMLR